MNNFAEQLRWSEQASDEPFWEAVYKKAFPNFVSHMAASGDTDSQRMGIDRIVALGNGRLLKIDEKKRTRAWDDILLEYVSVDKTGAPGWIEKDLQIDYLAYAFMPTKQCYLFDWLMLRRAWLQFSDEWKAKYSTKRAKNNGYTTLNVAIPIPVLRSAVARASLIDLSCKGAAL